jgi:hypothetical protein
MFVIGLVIITGLIPLTNTGQAAQLRPPQAGLVVRFGDDSVETRCVDLGSNGTLTSEQMLRQSGLDVTVAFDPGAGAAVCKIGQEGCNYPSEGCFCQCTFAPGQPCRYWAFYHLGPNGWVFSQQGASSFTVRDGSVQGWSWGPGGVGAGVEPPLVDFETICVQAAATATPTATTQPSATATVQPSATTQASATATMTAQASATATPTATNAPAAGGVPTPMIAPVPSSTPPAPAPTAPARTATPTASVAPSVTLAPTLTATPEDLATEIATAGIATVVQIVAPTSLPPSATPTSKPPPAIPPTATSTPAAAGGSAEEVPTQAPVAGLATAAPVFVPLVAAQAEPTPTEAATVIPTEAATAEAPGNPRLPPPGERSGIQVEPLQPQPTGWRALPWDMITFVGACIGLAGWLIAARLRKKG